MTQRANCPKGVEQFEMSINIEKRLLLTLTVDIDEERAQLSQQRLCGKLMVDEDLVSAGGGEFAPDYYFPRFVVRLIWFDTGGFQNRIEFFIWCYQEQAFNKGPV